MREKKAKVLLNHKDSKNVSTWNSVTFCSFFYFLRLTYPWERKMEPLLESCIQQVVTAAQVELILGPSCR